MAVFWVVAPCSLVEVYRRFRGACCLHHQAVIVGKLLPDYTRRNNPEDSHFHPLDLTNPLAKFNFSRKEEEARQLAAAVITNNIVFL
jgi:hypothetical protein